MYARFTLAGQEQALFGRRKGSRDRTRRKARTLGGKLKRVKTTVAARVFRSNQNTKKGSLAYRIKQPFVGLAGSVLRGG